MMDAAAFLDDWFQMETGLSLLGVHDLTGASRVWADYGLTGRGQTIAVIDTGIAYNHLALGNGYGSGYRVVGGYDFAENDTDPFDDGPYGGHGTHVAGIIASTDPVARGIAPGVDLVALRVFTDQGTGTFGWVEQALRWVHQNRNAFRYPITAVNLSLGCQWNSNTVPSWAMLEDEFAQLASSGIFISVAAGNGFQQYNQPGLSYPAVSSYVVPVASVDGNGLLSYYSQRDARAIAAPGRAILSTVPDYLGDKDGVGDDFASFSGTSMAAPYVAGASALLREAYYIVGITDVTQSRLYNAMYSTADVFYDSATRQNYRRLNLGAAIDSIIPADEYGSTPNTAYQLGALGGSKSLAGMIGQLADRDFFSFTATATGTIKLTANVLGNLQAQWYTVNGAGNLATHAGSSLSLNVVAGQTYTVGLGTAAGIGRYTIQMQLTPSITRANWGTITQRVFSDHTIDSTGREFILTASRTGILTIEAMFNSALGNVDLQLFDANGRLLAVANSNANQERINFNASADQQFILRAYTRSGINPDVDFRITNLVSWSGNTVNVWGTDGADQFIFRAGTVHQVGVNGVIYNFSASAMRNLVIAGGGGTDTAMFFASAGNDAVTFRPGTCDLSGSNYSVRASSVENITVNMLGGNDRAVFYDSPGNDTFMAGRGYASMVGPGYSVSVQQCETIYAYASQGNDTARFHATAGDTLALGATQATLSAPGYLVRANSFKTISGMRVAGISAASNLAANPQTVMAERLANASGRDAAVQVVASTSLHITELDAIAFYLWKAERAAAPVKHTGLEAPLLEGVSRAG